MLAEVKLGKLDFLKLKNFFATKDTIKRVKRQPTKWEETITNRTSDKDLISRIHRKLLQSPQNRMFWLFTASFALVPHSVHFQQILH